VVGALSVVVSNQRYESLRACANELASIIKEMTETTDQVTQASEYISLRIQETSHASNVVSGEVDQIMSITSFLKEIASQANLIGINAAIEAARVGEHGKIFSIVAQEIRKMADRSEDSVKDIQNKLEHIQLSIHRIKDAIHQITLNIEEHQSRIEELKAAFDHIANTADKLTQMSS
jgi:methyl-accepting chemotaxis protein